jgi:hypothetical protein
MTMRCPPKYWRGVGSVFKIPAPKKGKFQLHLLRLYNSVIKPVATYACETWVLKEYDKGKLLASEKMTLRKIYGPYREKDYTWSIRRNTI